MRKSDCGLRRLNFYFWLLEFDLWSLKFLLLELDKCKVAEN